MASGGSRDVPNGYQNNSRSRSVNVALPTKLEIHGGSLDVNWKRFKRAWRNYIVASRVGEESHDFQTAVLLSCIGDDANDVYDGFDFEPGQDRNIDVVLAKFEAFCVGQTNEVYESYVFFKRNQEPGETVDCYVAVLRRLIKKTATMVTLRLKSLSCVTVLWRVSQTKRYVRSFYRRTI